MILLDIVGLTVLIGAFALLDQRPEILEPDMTTRPMSLREWLEADTVEFIPEPVDEPIRGTNKKAETVTSYQLQYGNDLLNMNTRKRLGGLIKW